MIAVYAVGYVKKDEASYGAHLSTTSPDGEDVTFESSKNIGKYTKNQADLIAIIMALRCIKLDQRHLPITLHPAPGYAYQICDKSAAGKWLSTPKANVEIVEKVRATMDEFPNLRLGKVQAGNEVFLKCLEAAKTCRN